MNWWPWSFVLGWLSACSVTLLPAHTPIAHIPVGDTVGIAATSGVTTAAEKTAFVTDRWCTSTAMRVTVANPAPLKVNDDVSKAYQRVVNKPQVFEYGSSCDKNPGGYIQGVAYDAVLDRVLVRYFHPPPRANAAACPNGTVFFLPWDDFYKQCVTTPPVESSKSQGRTEAQEKAVVEKLLRDPN